MKKIIVHSGIILCLITACQTGTKNENTGKYSNIFQKYNAGIEDIRNFLISLKTSLPDAGNEIIPVQNIEPAINFGYDDTCNIIVLQYHLLSTPEFLFSYDSLFGLYYSLLAKEAFKWTGKTTKAGIIENAYQSDSDVDKILSSLSTEHFPYLLIVKATGFESLKTNSDKTFEGGGASASYYLYDLRNKKLLSSVSLSASPDEGLNFAYNSGEAYAEGEAFRKKAVESMQKNMQNKVYKWLKEITNNSAIVPDADGIY